jgi:hypothetical protein
MAPFPLPINPNRNNEIISVNFQQQIPKNMTSFNSLITPKSYSKWKRSEKMSNDKKMRICQILKITEASSNCDSECSTLKRMESVRCGVMQKFEL